MRVVLVVLLTLLPAAGATAAPLVGTSGSGPVRLLDRGLEPVAGTPRLPRRTDATLRSPDRTRIATWRFGRGTISVRDARTGRVLRELKTGGGVEASWPTRNRIVAVNTQHGGRPNVVRSFDVRTGRARVQRLAGTQFQIEADGRVTRILLAQGELDQSGSFTVAEIGAAGRVKRNATVPLPEGMDGDATVRLNGDRLLASQGERHALISLDGTVTPLALSPGEWDWVGPALIAFNSEVVQIDRDTGALGKRATVDPNEYLTATPDGGFLVGIGQARYDRDLRLVAENAVPAKTEHTPIVFSGARFYAVAYDCTGFGDDYRMVIGSAATGRVLKERPGKDWRVGGLGEGYFRAERFDIDCE